MKFLRKNINTDKYVDSIFSVVTKAKQDKDPNTINATAGCLYDESGKLFIYKTVFENASKIENRRKASYASSPKGNPEYIDAICKYVLEGKVNNNYDAIATVGGMGAIYAGIKLCTNDNDTLIYPSIAWGNYSLIAKENNLKSLTYDVYDLNDLFNNIDKCEGKIFLIINSPCENPLGHSYTIDQWQQIVYKLNSINKEAILLVDNAYMDYAYDHSKEFLSFFNNISDNVLVLIAVSCSKSFSYYGYRMGALIAINNDKEFVEQYINLASRLARTTWSNVSNGAMLNVADVLNNHYDEYIKERDESILMLKRRTDLFIKESNEVGLDLYPYSEGFFVTIKIEDDDKLLKAHNNLIDHHIYTIKVKRGLRVGICSVPYEKVKGLAKRIKDLI